MNCISTTTKPCTLTPAILAAQLLAGLSVMLGLCAAASHAQEVDSPSEITQLGTITPIDVPGATVTLATDINAEGSIVGRYASAGRTHGFLRSPNGDFTTIDFPGASLTVAAAINNFGDIVGQYALPTAPTERHGFLFRGGVFTSVDPPGSVFTNILGINERGDVVGRYCTQQPCAAPGSGSFHGFLLHDGEFTTVDVPGALETDLFKVNSPGRIVGGFLTPDHKEQIVLLANGNFTILTPPGGQPVSLDNGGINERGDIVGTYCDWALPCLITPVGTHGFLITGGAFTTIDVPGAAATAAIGINARGDVVGSYSDAKGVHGFLLSRFQTN
jgi:uncharacterized membrane protein